MSIDERTQLLTHAHIRFGLLYAAAVMLLTIDCTEDALVRSSACLAIVPLKAHSPPKFQPSKIDTPAEPDIPMQPLFCSSSASLFL